MSALRRLAAAAPVPVFVALGGGARAAVDELRADPRLRLVSTPRAATVLLVAGTIPEPLRRPLAQVHDQLPHPRASVWWTGSEPAPVHSVLPQAVAVTAESGTATAVEALVTAHRGLLLGSRESAHGVLPDAPPAPWRGIGPFGQGGEGMMGGKPYGRPMAMTDDDRDGLALDRLPLRLGPFLDPLPPGLVLDVALQGDVLVEAEVGPNPFDPGGEVLGSPVLRQAAPVAVRRMHQARRLLGVIGLPAWAHRVARLAVAPDPAALARLRRALERARVLHPALAGVAVIEAGPDAGDALARLRAWLDEAEAAMVAGPPTAAEPAPRAHAERLGRLGEQLVGREWGEAITLIASLDLDLEAAARRPAKRP